MVLILVIQRNCGSSNSWKQRDSKKWSAFTRNEYFANITAQKDFPATGKVIVPHQNLRWSHWGISDTRYRHCWCSPRCKSQRSLGWKQTLPRSHRTTGCTTPGRYAVKIRSTKSLCLHIRHFKNWQKNLEKVVEGGQSFFFKTTYFYILQVFPFSGRLEGCITSLIPRSSTSSALGYGQKPNGCSKSGVSKLSKQSASLLGFSGDRL